MTEAISIQGLSVDVRSPTSGTLRVLDGIDLEVRRGELLSILGPSGCGKTTLLHILTGLTVPSEGRVRTEGVSTALVFQRPRLLPWRTVLDNAIYGLLCRGDHKEDARRAAEPMLARMGLSGHLQDLPHQLSEGMKQRVNMARALLVEPDVLLLDEPFAALDVMTKRSLQDELLRLWQERALTVVFVSHSIEEVVYLSDRVVVMTDKPTRIRSVETVRLERPRARGPAEKLAMWEEVERLEAVLAAHNC